MPQGTPISTISSPGATPRTQATPTNGGESNAGATSQPNSVATSNAPQTKSVREPRISNISAIKMVAAGILLDLVALIPFVGGYAAEIIGGLTFFLWFLILGLPLMSPKTVANWALNLIVGETATAGAWPGFTIGAILTVVMTRTEDKTGLDVMSLTKGDVKSLGEVGKNLSGQMQARFTGGASQGGATPAPKTPTDGTTAKEVNPVIASQQEHFADPSVPVTQGATAPTQRTPKAPQPRRQANPQDEEVVTGLRNQNDEPSFARDPYREDAYALESDEQPRGIDSLPRQGGQKEEPRVPFPGAGSSSFGRGERQGGKLLDFKQKEAPQETAVDEIPTGATPRSEAA